MPNLHQQADEHERHPSVERRNGKPVRRDGDDGRYGHHGAMMEVMATVMMYIMNFPRKAAKLIHSTSCLTRSTTFSHNCCKTTPLATSASFRSPSNVSALAFEFEL